MDDKHTPVHQDASSQSERTLPYSLVRRLVTLSLVFGLLGGLVGGYGLVRFGTSLIPTSKQSVVLQESSAAINVANKVSPSVVSITTSTQARSFFFGQSQTQQGAGTGIIVSDDGLIMTNNHVVEGASSLTVYSNEGKEYKNAQVVATDGANDLAFIRIKASGLKAATLGDSSQVKVGTRVVAIGNALGQYQNTVTEGIISGIGRPVTAGDASGGGVESLQNLFQTDAAINPGNSGGPLVDLSGNVIGINTAVAGNAQNVGFSIPINEAKKALVSVKDKGKIVRPYLGVRYVPITPDFAAANNLPTGKGAYVNGDGQNGAVVSGSPAEKAGLKDGDIITKIGSKTIDQSHSLSALIGEHNVGDKVEITYLRDGKSQTATVTLQEASNS